MRFFVNEPSVSSWRQLASTSLVLLSECAASMNDVLAGVIGKPLALRLRAADVLQVGVRCRGRAMRRFSDP
jgi:hypothetical protein